MRIFCVFAQCEKSMRKFLLGAHSEPEELRSGVVILRELMQGKFYERFRPTKSRLRLTNGAKPGKKKKKKTCFRFPQPRSASVYVHTYVQMESIYVGLYCSLRTRYHAVRRPVRVTLPDFLSLLKFFLHVHVQFLDVRQCFWT